MSVPPTPRRPTPRPRDPRVPVPVCPARRTPAPRPQITRGYNTPNTAKLVQPGEKKVDCCPEKFVFCKQYVTREITKNGIILRNRGHDRALKSRSPPGKIGHSSLRHRLHTFLEVGGLAQLRLLLELVRGRGADALGEPGTQRRP